MRPRFTKARRILLRAARGNRARINSRTVAIVGPVVRTGDFSGFWPWAKFLSGDVLRFVRCAYGTSIRRI